jgi:hypothetical protein
MCHLTKKQIHHHQPPTDSQIMIRLSVMATQSADVERVCKVHKIVHTKGRNRLKNAKVVKLLYCYVNLRLLKALDVDHADNKHGDLEGFLFQALLDEVDGDDG